MIKILCATDGSECAGRAVSIAARLAHEGGFAITLLAVYTATDKTAGSDDYWHDVEVSLADIRPESVLGRALKVAHDRGVPQPRLVKAFGKNPALAIAAYARHYGYNHIVTGHQGRSGLNRLFMGSVAEELLKAATCPVTIVK